MNEDQFWALIDVAHGGSPGDLEGRAERLGAAHGELGADDIQSFQNLFDALMDRAYTWELWGAAYILGGGCSDDGFTDFRAWLTSLGRDRYERAIAAPDSMAEHGFGLDDEADFFFEEFAYVPADVLEARHGRELADRASPHPMEPAGDRWDEDGDDLERRFPRLWDKYGEAW